MKDDSDVNPNEESEAIVLYLGRGLSSFPKPSAARLVNRFGCRAETILASVEAILEELRRFEPDWSTQTLLRATDEAVRRVARAHPNLSDDALAALRWYFSYGWK